MMVIVIAILAFVLVKTVIRAPVRIRKCVLVMITRIVIEIIRVIVMAVLNVIVVVLKIMMVL